MISQASNYVDFQRLLRVTGLSKQTLERHLKTAAIAGQPQPSGISFPRSAISEWLVQKRKVTYQTAEDRKLSIELTSQSTSPGTAWFVYVKTGPEDGFFLEVKEAANANQTGLQLDAVAVIEAVHLVIDRGITEPFRVIVEDDGVLLEELWKEPGEDGSLGL